MPTLSKPRTRPVPMAGMAGLFVDDLTSSRRAEAAGWCPGCGQYLAAGQRVYPLEQCRWGCYGCRRGHR